MTASQTPENLTPTQETLAVMIGEMHASAEASTRVLAEAFELINDGNQNGAIGALAEIERRVDTLSKLYAATLSLHRI